MSCTDVIMDVFSRSCRDVKFVREIGCSELIFLPAEWLYILRCQQPVIQRYNLSAILNFDKNILSFLFHIYPSSCIQFKLPHLTIVGIVLYIALIISSQEFDSVLECGIHCLSKYLLIIAFSGPMF